MTIDEKGFWIGSNNLPHRFDQGVANYIREYMQKHSLQFVIDIGCGDGSYVSYLEATERYNIYAFGYDGNPETARITNGECLIQDFTVPVALGRYELVLSLEVGEHIPRKYEDVFIDNIIQSAKDHIILSWAIEGQGGDGHVNCRNNDYIVGKMENKGYLLNRYETDSIREASHLSWLKNTLMVFQKENNNARTF